MLLAQEASEAHEVQGCIHTPAPAGEGYGCMCAVGVNSRQSNIGAKNCCAHNSC